MSAVQKSDEWFAQRTTVSITGSQIGAIIGMNPYCNRDQALRRKVRECLGLPPDTPPNHLMLRGTEMEPVARSALEAETGLLVEETGMHVHPTIPWIGTSPDGLVPAGVVEIKVRETPKPCTHRMYDWAQCQLHMHVTGRDHCLYYQWNDSGGVLERVEIDPDFITNHHDRYLLPFHVELTTILDNEELQKPFREPLVEQRTDAEFSQAEHAYAEIKLALEAAQTAEKAIRAKLLKLAGDKACEGELVKVTTYERQGTVNWKSKDIQNALAIAGVNPESYRGKPSIQTRVTIK